MLYRFLVSSYFQLCLESAVLSVSLFLSIVIKSKGIHHSKPELFSVDQTFIPTKSQYVYFRIVNPFSFLDNKKETNQGDAVEISVSSWTNSAFPTLVGGLLGH